MRKTFLTGLSVVALAAVAGVATAQTPAARPAGAPAPHHQRGDADRDGQITRAEFVEARVVRLTALDADRDGTVSVAERETAMQARRAERADARFAKLDANSDGAISRAEFDAAHEARGERSPRPERAGHRGGPRHAMRGPGRQAGPVVISDVAAKLGERFDKMDADRNGVVTAEERRAAMPAHRGERRPGRAPQQPASPAPASE